MFFQTERELKHVIKLLLKNVHTTLMKASAYVLFDHACAIETFIVSLFQVGKFEYNFQFKVKKQLEINMKIYTAIARRHVEFFVLVSM